MLLVGVGCSSGHKSADEGKDGSTPEKDAGESGANGGGSGSGGSGGGAKDAGNGGTNTGEPDGSTSGTNTDAGNKADAMAADACANVMNACTEESATCMANTLVTCAKNNNGCLVTTRTNCTRNGTNFCDSSASPPKCAVDPCAGVTNCQSEGKTCDANTLVDCEKNSDGCLVATRTDCTGESGKNVCSGSPAACGFDKCFDSSGVFKKNVCVTPEASCSGNLSITCEMDDDGCLIAHRTDCTMENGKNFCASSADPAGCAFDPCLDVVNPCLNAGTTCDAGNLITCADDSNNCLVQTMQDCRNGSGLTCVPSDDSHASCAMCQNAVGCEGGASTGFCDTGSNTFHTCSDTDNDTCLNLTSEACGDKYTCDADPTKRCVFNGDPMCSSAIENTLREPMTYAGPPFNTDGAGNEYSSYTCPGLFTVSGNAADELFAVDVAAKTTVTISFASTSGFTSNPAIYLLTRCADTTGSNAMSAESSCQTAGTTVTYTNTGTTETRVYVVVDANNTTTNGTTSPNVGTFGLTLDSHAFVCGDGKREGDEACDDGNLREHDGCTPACKLETGYVCTAANPSVCTLRPTDNVCANVKCPDLPTTPTNLIACCTADQNCGVAYDFVYGSGCIERDQEGRDDTSCPTEVSTFPILLPDLTGCCRPDNQCGLRSAAGGGCVLRTDTWTNMQDGFGSFLYSGPFTAKSCQY